MDYVVEVHLNLYRKHYSSTVKGVEIQPPKCEVSFMEWADENEFLSEEFGDTEIIDSSHGYDYIIPLGKYLEYFEFIERKHYRSKIKFDL